MPTLCAYLDLGVNLLFEKRRPYAFILGWATIREGRVNELSPTLFASSFIGFVKSRLEFQICLKFA